MSDAEKYAKVFRAAADGIASNVLPKGFDLFAVGYQMTDADAKELKALGVSWINVSAAKEISGNPRETYVRWQLCTEIRAQYLAFSGVAEMFEKIVEAEKSSE